MRYQNGSLKGNHLKILNEGQKREEVLQNALHSTNVPLIFMHRHDRPNQSLIFNWLHPLQTHTHTHIFTQGRKVKTLSSVPQLNMEVDTLKSILHSQMNQIQIYFIAWMCMRHVMCKSNNKCMTIHNSVFFLLKKSITAVGQIEDNYMHVYNTFKKNSCNCSFFFISSLIKYGA